MPEEFADFSVYNSSLENKEWFSSKGDLVNPCVLEKDVSRSPTTSSVTSGYFSHSASNATLSEMLVPSSDSTEQLANQVRDLDSNDHTAAHLSPDLSSNESSEQESNVAKDKRDVSPIKIKTALARESTQSESAVDTGVTELHCSALDASANKNVQHGTEFPSRGATVECMLNVFEDHAFTEFMGVEDGKELENSVISQFCSSDSSNRRQKLSIAGKSCTSSFSKNTYNQDKPVSHLEAAPVGYPLSNSTEIPFLAAIVKEASHCQMYADSFLTDDFPEKSNLNAADCADVTSEEVPDWIAVGEQVCIGSNKTGIVKYIGPLDFSTGTWVGIELNIQMGKKTSLP